MRILNAIANCRLTGEGRYNGNENLFWAICSLSQIVLVRLFN